MISLRNITKEYRINEGCTIKALDSVSFDIYDSGVLYILGKSGCGKTTLLNVIGSLDSIDSGDILVDGKELASFTTQDIYSYRDSYIGFVFQEYNLIENLTVYENIKIALDIRRDSSLDKIRDVLDKVGLNGFENRKISELSGGQKQRVAIARTLVKSPKMILADEPTGNLDSATSKEIFDLLKDISKNTSVVIVSHDKESAQVYADRIVNMRDGKVIDINEMRPSGKIDENVLSLKKNYGLSLINSLKFALNGIKKRVFRFTMIVLIMILCLSSISFALAATYNDVNKIFLDACDKYDQDSVCVRKFDLSNSLKLSGDLCFNINNNDVSRITNIFDDDGIIVYNSNVDIPLARNIIYFSESTSFSLCAPSYDYINNHGLKIIYGRYPIYNNEVMISSAMFDIFKRCGFSKINGEELEISSIDQLLGEQIEGRIENYTIVGIIDTKPNESLYRQFLELYDNDPLSLDTNRVAGIMSYELYDSIHTSLFFSEDAFKYGLISEAGISFIGQNSLNRDDGLHVKRLTNTRFEDANEEPFLLQNYNDSVGVVLSLDFLLQFHRELLDDGKHDWYLKYNSNMQSYDDWVEFISNENVYVYFRYSEYKSEEEKILKVRVIGVHSGDSNLLYVNDKLGEIASENSGGVLGLQVFMDESYDVNKERLEKLHEVFTEDETEYNYNMMCGFYGAVAHMIDAKDNNWMIVFGLISVVLGIISALVIWNFTYTVIMDNKKKIGILISLGAHKKDIYAIFLMESVLIWIISNLLSYTLIPLYRYIFGDTANCIHMFNYTAWIIILVWLYSFGITMLGSIFSIVKFVNDKPINIIRR